MQDLLKDTYDSILSQQRQSEKNQIKFMKKESLIKNFVVAQDNDIRVTLLSTRFGYFYKLIQNNSKKESAYAEEIDGKEVVIKAGESYLYVSSM